MANKSYYWRIVIFRWFPSRWQTLPACKEINQLLLRMIWFSRSPYSVRYDHPLWPEILQKSCYSSPLWHRMTPFGVQKGGYVCGSRVGERGPTARERRDYLGRCSLLMCCLWGWKWDWSLRPALVNSVLLRWKSGWKVGKEGRKRWRQILKDLLLRKGLNRWESLKGQSLIEYS